MIKKELGVFRRVPGSSDQNTDLDITLITAKKTDNEKIKSAAKIYFSTIAN